MNMKKLLVVMALSALTLSGCASEKVDETTNDTSVETKESTVNIKEQEDINKAAIKEDETVYSSDDSDSVVCFYVTVRKGAAGSETAHTFSEVNSVKKFEDDEHVNAEVKADALVQVGDETGP